MDASAVVRMQKLHNDFRLRNVQDNKHTIKCLSEEPGFGSLRESSPEQESLRAICVRDSDAS